LSKKAFSMLVVDEGGTQICCGEVSMTTCDIPALHTAVAATHIALTSSGRLAEM
jgi:hypothetical protein